MATHREEGIPLTAEVYTDLLTAAERYGVSPETLESGSISCEGKQR
jgi:hypothetical protein